MALDVTDRDAKGKGEVALLEKEAGFEMVEKNDEDDEDDEDAVAVDDDDIEGIVEEEDDYVKVSRFGKCFDGVQVVELVR